MDRPDPVRKEPDILSPLLGRHGTDAAVKDSFFYRFGTRGVDRLSLRDRGEKGQKNQARGTDHEFFPKRRKEAPSSARTLALVSRAVNHNCGALDRTSTGSSVAIVADYLFFGVHAFWVVAGEVLGGELHRIAAIQVGRHG